MDAINEIRTKLNLKEEEIYETEDIPNKNLPYNLTSTYDQELIPNFSDFKEGIINDSLEVKKSFKKFHHLDSSPSTLSLKKEDHIISSLLNKNICEDPLQKFNRIKSELNKLQNDLKESIESSEANTKSSFFFNELLNECEKLSSKAKEVENHNGWKVIPKSNQADILLNKLADKIDSAANNPTPKILPESTNNLANIDEKLTNLEKSLGIFLNSSKSYTNSTSLTIFEQYRILEEKSLMINSNFLDQTKLKANSIKWEIETYIKKNISSSSSINLLENEILTKFEQLKEFSTLTSQVVPYLDKLPQLLIHLKSLSIMLSNHIMYKNKLSYINQSIDYIVDMISSNSDALNELQIAIKENKFIIEENLKNIL